MGTRDRINWRFRALLTLALAVFVAAVAILWRADRQVKLRVVGPETVIFDWSEDACEPKEIPDVPVRAFRDDRGRLQLVAFNHTSHRLIGDGFDNLVHDCAALMTSHRDPDPARFDDLEWIHSVYALGGGEVVALVHNEYQGNTHPGRCPSGELRRCWYNSITMAVSRDDGDSYTHAAAPNHLVAALSERYRPGVGPAGLFNPSNVIHRPKDGYYYCLFRIVPYDGAPGVSLMRTRDLLDPGSWRAWDGSAFTIRFRDPYQGHPDTGANRPPGPRPVAPAEIRGMCASLTYNTYLQRYLLVGTAKGLGARPGQWTTGFYFSLSEDMIHWTPRQLIFEVERPSSWENGDPGPAAYPSLIDPASPSRNFETTGKRNQLYFVRFNFATGGAAFDRDLIRVPVEFD